MAFVLDPSARVQKVIRVAARERLDLALDRLSGLKGKEAAEIEEAVHEARKRCKEVRALARLVRAAIGPEYEQFNQLVRDAADELGAIRDAHAVLATLDDLRLARGGTGEKGLDRVRAAQATHAEAATRSVRGGDPRIERSISLLTEARKRISSWHIPSGTSWLEAGIEDTYAAGRADHRKVQKRPTDDGMHEWRKSVKRLWYQIRLVETAAPSVLRPFIHALDDLAEALGDDHDLTVLIERLESHPKRFGGKKSAKHAVAAAQGQQDDLRRRAIRLGSTLYAEAPGAFVARVVSYWKTTRRAGPELATGGIAELMADEAPKPKASTSPSPPAESIERERKFLVDYMPELAGEGTRFRQGYLAIDGRVSVRVRDASAAGCTLTVKAGRGAVRTELEWPITAEQFEQGWQHTAERRVHKTRHLVALGDGATAELDDFHDDLEGLLLVEVEFSSDDQMAAFKPPAWFGLEVTDDPSYTNSMLSVRGRP